MSSLFTLISLVLFGSVFALIGGIAFLSLPRWSDLLARYSVPFAGGVLLTVALIGLLPESVELIGDTTFTITLVTFLIIYVFENLFFSLHHHDDEDEHHHIAKRSAWFVMVGDTIHNFIDGVAIAAAFSITPGLGALTAVSTFLHEVPHEIGDFGVLLKAHWSKRSIIATNVIS
ncbi:ZIP family metal transporter, partial [Candidatus Woesebacteria bacterium]|nr:ZIP family metal transporter [Candidatus Woesebacteria bacterium]